MTKRQTTQNNETLLKDGRLDVNKIVDKIVSDGIALLEPKLVNEAFVATPKSTPQVTEFVTQRTKDAHEALYRRHVEAFTRTSAELDSVSRAPEDAQRFGDLKRAETNHLNSLWLHELFFANCFDPHSNVYMNSVSYLKLQSSFGSFDDWQRDFIACANATEQGWVICGYHTYLRSYVNTIVSLNNVDVLVGLIPVIVIDMHEHSRRDYLNDKKSYVVAMMQELNWEVISERFERAEAIARIVKQG